LEGNIGREGIGRHVVGRGRKSQEFPQGKRDESRSKGKTLRLLFKEKGVWGRVLGWGSFRASRASRRKKERGPALPEKLLKMGNLLAVGEFTTGEEGE